MIGLDEGHPVPHRNRHALPTRRLLMIGALAGLVCGSIGAAIELILGGRWWFAALAGVLTALALMWPAWTVRAWRVREAGTWFVLLLVWHGLSAASVIAAGVLLYSSSRSRGPTEGLVLAVGYLSGVLGQAMVYNGFVQRLPRPTRG